MMKNLLVASLLLAGPLFGSQWPQEFTSGDSKITVYEPEYVSLADNVLVADAAVSVLAPGDAQPSFGEARMQFRVAQGASHMLTAQGIVVEKLKLPSASPAQVESYSADIQNGLMANRPDFPDDEVKNAISSQDDSDNGYGTSAPKVIVAKHPAVLVVIDGEPILTDVDGSTLKRVSNTPFFLVNDPGSRTYYLKGGDTWYAASDIKGEWKSISEPPADVVGLEEKYRTNEDSAQMAQASDLQQKSGKIPDIIVSTEPAELIATDGEPAMTPIKGTGLLYVSNTPADVFMEISSQDYFVLLSGRWYKSKSLDGPWSFVSSDKLPGDFAKIPPNSEKDAVLANVSGTIPATDAVLDAKVPQAATVQRNSATTEVAYDGDPEFQPIENTGMQYAVNTSSSVILIGGQYYDCDRGIWFQSGSPTGPWTVCVSVPPEIYTIPPRSPLYHVRFVRVYGFTPSVVYVGYTAGYTGCYVYNRTVIYGTGFYYRPWHRRWYYPRPYTWGFAVHYNPWSGWTIGIGTVWGRPYGWFAYNWGPHYGGWWGPVGYRPWYYHTGGHIYRAGYRPAPYVRRPFATGRSIASVSRYAATRPPTLYQQRTVGIVRSSAVNRGRPAGSLRSPNTPARQLDRPARQFGQQNRPNRSPQSKKELGAKTPSGERPAAHPNAKERGKKKEARGKKRERGRE
ncbi:MAG TPA: hypothetical protein VLY03_04045 [Bacteroidota bacterium]|nr:hypothetical protein [Bacteroidota bacterium]